MVRVSANWVPDRGEIIFIDHSPAKGHEIPDEHPMLVTSFKAFNEKTGIVIGFPMTHSQPHMAGNLFAFELEKKTTPANTKLKIGPSYVLAFQPKSFDWRKRGARPHSWGAGYIDEVVKALDIFDRISRPPSP